MLILPFLSSLSILLADSKSEIKINNNINSVENNISVSTNSNTNTSVKINNDKFEIEGTLDSISSDAITVSGQSIRINSSQKENLIVGQNIRVSGTIKNGILYGEIINSEVLTSPSFTPSVTLSPAATSPLPASATPQSSNLISKFISLVLNFLKNIF